MICAGRLTIAISLSRRKRTLLAYFATSEAGRHTHNKKNGPDGSSYYMRADEYLL